MTMIVKKYLKPGMKILDEGFGSEIMEPVRCKRRKLITTNMICGSFYIPKLNPLKPYGEDSHFVSEADKTFGVADGVGGWAKKGIDAGVYARELMRNSATAVQNQRKTSLGAVDPMRVLQEAYDETKAQGSSTACIVTLDGRRLRVANVGDSGFWIFRDNQCFFISPIQQRRFNCPKQLGNAETSDRPGCAAEMEVLVEPGDIVVAGTDGLLDNVYPSEIEAVLSWMEEEEQELEAEQFAQQIAEIALYNSQDEDFHSPFQLAAEKADFEFTGGKIDDITVIVALII